MILSVTHNGRTEKTKLADPGQVSDDMLSWYIRHLIYRINKNQFGEGYHPVTGTSIGHDNDI